MRALDFFLISITWGDQIALDIILDKLNRFLYLGKLVFHEILDMLKIILAHGIGIADPNSGWKATRRL